MIVFLRVCKCDEGRHLLVKPPFLTSIHAYVCVNTYPSLINEQNPDVPIERVTSLSQSYLVTAEWTEKHEMMFFGPEQNTPLVLGRK